MFQRALHDRANRIARRIAQMQDTVHLFGDGEIDVVFAGKCQKRVGGAHSFCNHFHFAQNLGQCATAAKLKSHMAVSAEDTVACEYEIA